MKPMTCPVCGEETKVEGSRGDVETVARKRRCKKCRYVFFTVETETEDAKQQFIEFDYKYKNYELFRKHKERRLKNEN